jgi:predicted ATP-grasp superfamily ATP-dependent carboligase
MVPAVVIGLGVNGLGTVRALGRRGVPAIVITNGSGDPPEHTRFAEKVALPAISDPAALIECLVEQGRKFAGKSILFPSGDLSLGYVSEHRSELEPYYHLPMPSHDVVDLILSKSRFYRFAQDHGLPIARTFFPDSPEAADRIARDITYPCLIKPSIATPEWRARGLKILQCNDAAELGARFRMAWGIHRDLIVQEVTPGPDSSLFFSLTYLDRSGAPLAMFTGRKVRQYVPHFGISSLAESLWDPEIAGRTERTLAALNYSGYGSIEFKRHAVTGEYLMTEVTGRTWYPHALSERCGINLPWIAYSDLVLGTRAKVPESFPDHVKWIDEVGDFKSAMWYWRRGELSLADWRRSYAGKRYWALATWDDTGPILALGRRFLFRAITWPFRKLARLVRR